MKKRDYYEVLGVQKNAITVEIVQAYRTKAKELHPDTGGDAEAMRELNEAYECLSDDARRAEYDASGCDADKMGRRGRVEAVAKDLFTHYIIEGVAPSCMLDRMREHVRDYMATEKANQRDVERQIARLKSYLRAAKVKAGRKGAGDMFDALTEGLIADGERKIENSKRQVEESRDVLELLGEYEYAGKVEEGAGPMTPDKVRALLAGSRVFVSKGYTPTSFA